MICCRCNLSHKGKKSPCYRCRNLMSVNERNRAQREFWRSCIEVAGDIIYRAVRGGK